MMKARFYLLAAVSVVSCFGLVSNGWAQSVPYRASGQQADYFPGNGDYNGFGKGLHLGRHSIDGNVVPVGDFFPEAGVFFRGTFTGTQTVTAADGSTLEMSLYGDVELVFNDDGLVEGLWFPIFSVTGGDGRFTGATGEMQGVAINSPFNPADAVWPFDWSIEGNLNWNNR